MSALQSQHAAGSNGVQHVTMQNSIKESPKFSPVALSPGAVYSQARNLTGNPRLVRDVAAEVHASIQQWNSLHLEGVSLLKTITLLKVDKYFPKELQKPCEELEQVCDEIDNIVENLSLLVSQIRAISNLHKPTNYVFATWKAERFVPTVETIFEAYKKEASVKRVILQNVAHDYRDSWKMLHLSAWVHQTQIPDHLNTMLESMLLEVKLR